VVGRQTTTPHQFTPLRKPPRTTRGVRDARPSRNLTRHDERVADLSDPDNQVQAREPRFPAPLRETTWTPSSHEGPLLTQAADLGTLVLSSARR
jgi:hypothetical protein